MIVTERNRSSLGLSLKSGVCATFALGSSSSGGGVCGKMGSVRLFLLAGPSGLPPSLSLGVERFREIGEMGAMIALGEFVSSSRDVIEEISTLQLYKSKC
jgi:hypothetical protein